jgi:hypothetical protein
LLREAAIEWDDVLGNSPSDHGIFFPSPEQNSIAVPYNLYATPGKSKSNREKVLDFEANLFPQSKDGRVSRPGRKKLQRSMRS